MPHISKKNVERKAYEKLYMQLVEDILQRGQIKTRDKMLSELLTKTEKVMLAKRFAAICMLGQGFTFDEIEKKLQLSSSTIIRYWKSARKGEFKHTVEHIVKRRKGRSVAEILLDSFIGPFQPITAPRWRWLDELND